MKTKFKETSYPKFHIKFTLDGKPINTLSTRKSLRIMHRIKLSETKFKWDRVFLRIMYDRNLINEGYYFDPKELKSAYHCFMELILTG